MTYEEQKWGDHNPLYPADAARLQHLDRGIKGEEEARIAEIAKLNEETIGRGGYLNALNNGVGNNGGDQTTAISNFFDACHAAGKGAYFPKGTYATKAITKTYGLNILSDPSVTFEHSGYWTFEGKLGTPLNLEAEAIRGTNALKITTTGLKAGEVLLIGTVTPITGETGTGRTRGQLVEILEIKSATELVVRENLYRTFEPHSGTDKTTVTPVSTITMSYLGGPLCSNPTEANIGFINIKYGRDIDIDVQTEGQWQFATGVTSCYGFRIRSRSKHGKWNNTNQFGYSTIALSGSCHGEVDTVTINGNFDFTTSTVNNESGEPYNIRVTGVNAGSNSAGAFSTHPSGHDIIFVGCTALFAAESVGKTGTAFTSSCPDVTFSDCYARNAFNGIEVAKFAQAKNRFIDCTLRECVTGAIVRGGEDHEIAGCCFEELEGVGIRGQEGEELENVKTKTLTRFHSKDNTFRNIGTAKKSAEFGAYRFEKEVKQSVIQNDIIHAAGSDESVLRFDVAAEKTLVQRVVIKERPGATNWGKISATAVKIATTGEGQAQKTSEAIEGVTFRYNWVDE